jgi:hypothetical protein
MARWGGAILVALAPLPWLGLGTASATNDATYATVSGHQAFSSDANHPDYWGDNCTKLPGGSFTAYVLTADQAKVIVKAGSGAYANTIFMNASEGETVWADTNGDGVYNPGGKGGDKQISHIIVCGGGGTTTEPEPTDTTTKPEPTDTTTKPEPTDTTTKPEPTDTTTEPEPTDTTTSGTPTETETSGSASPSTTTPTTPIETGSSEPGDKNTSKEASVEATRLTQPAALPATGSGMPVGTALAISMLLIGLGALLLIGPGRLVAERYYRKH